MNWANNAEAFERDIARTAEVINAADAVFVGTGAGLSTAAGFTYSGERFERYFADFHARYGFTDMYSGGFYPYATSEELWAFWSRYVMVNRYDLGANPLYVQLRKLLEGRDYFVLTTNVDHQFQLAGFDKRRLFYTQGDYGLFQCSGPCCAETFDNEAQVRAMYEQQRDLRISSELIPRCPHCGREMTMNLRADDKFVQDEGWYAAQALRRFRAPPRGHARGVPGAGRGVQHAGDHQVPVLARRAREFAGHLRVRELRRSGGAARDRRPIHLHQRRFGEDDRRAFDSARPLAGPRRFACGKATAAQCAGGAVCWRKRLCRRASIDVAGYFASNGRPAFQAGFAGEGELRLAGLCKKDGLPQKRQPAPLPFWPAPMHGFTLRPGEILASGAHFEVILHDA